MSLRVFCSPSTAALPLAGRRSPATPRNRQNGGVSHADVAQSGAANDFTIARAAMPTFDGAVTGGHNDAMVGQMGRFNNATVG